MHIWLLQFIPILEHQSIYWWCAIWHWKRIRLASRLSANLFDVRKKQSLFLVVSRFQPFRVRIRILLECWKWRPISVSLQGILTNALAKVISWWNAIPKRCNLAVPWTFREIFTDSILGYGLPSFQGVRVRSISENIPLIIAICEFPHRWDLDGDWNVHKY